MQLAVVIIENVPRITVRPSAFAAGLVVVA